ncbi:unnamed protein product [Closterium sp. NIES-65]|nr:unnamed protein product [Closterium sp. NIES-65]
MSLPSQSHLSGSMERKRVGSGSSLAPSAAAAAQAPLVCHGHSRPIVEIAYSPITDDGFFLISASKGARAPLSASKGPLAALLSPRLPSPSVKVRVPHPPSLSLPVMVRATPPLSASTGPPPPPLSPPVKSSHNSFLLAGSPARSNGKPSHAISPSPLTTIPRVRADGKPMIRNGETGDWIGTFEGHKGAVWGACLDRPALLAATASADFTARIWDALTGDEKHKLEHKHIVRTVDFSKDSRQLLTGGAEKVVRVFDLARPDAGPTLSLEGMAGPVRCARWHNDDRWILVTCNDVAGVKVFDARSKDVVGVMATDGACLSMDISPAATGGGGAGGSAFITTADGSTVKIFDARSLQEVKSHRLPHQAESASYIPSTNRFVAGGEDLWVRVFDYETGQQLECHKGHHGPVHCIRFAPDALSYASGSEDGTIRIWKLAPATAAEGAAAGAAGSAADGAASGADAAGAGGKGEGGECNGVSGVVRVGATEEVIKKYPAATSASTSLPSPHQPSAPLPPMAASPLPSSAPPPETAAPAASSPNSPPPPPPTPRAPLSLRLWRDARSQRVAQAAAYHPFVLALGAGTLPRRRFVRYSLQDAFFLSAFAHSYGAAASLLDGGEEDGTGGAGGKDGAAEGEEELSVRAVLQRLQREADGELQMHAATVKAWIEESSDSQAADATADVTADSAPLPATLEYTSFLSHVVAGTSGVWDSHGLGSRVEQDESSAGQHACEQGSHHNHVPHSSSCSSSSELVVLSRPADWIAESDRSSPAARRWHTLCVLAAMLPCMRLYASIGHTMGGAAWGLHAAAAGGVGGAEEGERGGGGSNEVGVKGRGGVSEEWRWHPYGQWLHTYSCPGFEAAAALLESAFDRLWSLHLRSLHPSCAPSSPIALQQQQHVAEQHLSRVYSRAMQLELSFFHAQLAPFPATPPPPLPPPHASDAPPSLPAWRGFFHLASQEGARAGREASGGGGEAGGEGKAAGVVFAVDFDGTCTVDDSSALLARLALAHAAPAGKGISTNDDAAAGGGGECGGSRQQVWDDLVQRYVRDYSDFMHAHLPPTHAHRDSSSSSNSNSSRSSKQGRDESRESSRTAGSTPAHLPPGLLPFLHRLSSFEAAANQRVTGVAALQGIPRDAMLAAAREAADVAEGEGVGQGRGSFRSGCGRVLRRVEGEGGVVQVVSVSWCGAYVGEAVRHAMRMAGGKRGEEGTQEDKAEGKEGETECGEKMCSGGGPEGGAGVGSRVVVRANEMEFDERGVSTDSTTDLLPLLRAQVGVVMAGGASSLERVIQALGVHRLPLVALALLHMQQGAAGEAKVNGEGCVDARPVMEVAPWTLLDASCWEELEVFLFGIHFTEIDSEWSGNDAIHALPLPAAVLALVGAALVSCWYSLAAG